MRGALDNLIGSVGLDVRLFASPREFLDADRPDAPACLVLDVRLQGMTGLAFHEELVSTGVALPVIFITGHADVPMTVRAMKAGAVEFLTKPFRDVELLDAIHAAIERDRDRRQAAASLDMLRLRYGQLTAREREVMALVAGGLANKQVAAAAACERGHREGASRPGDAQDARPLACRTWCAWPTAWACRSKR